MKRPAVAPEPTTTIAIRTGPRSAKTFQGKVVWVPVARPGNELAPIYSNEGYLRDLSQESESAILAWSGGHGLLGVLLSRWESVTLSPRSTGPDPNIRIQERYLRGYGTTICRVQTKGDLPEARSCVLIHPLHELTTKEEPLTDTWACFFPSVPEQKRETFAYPAPYTQEFWELYAEPLSEFWRAARLFAGAVQHLGASAKPIPGGATSAHRNGSTGPRTGGGGSQLAAQRRQPSSAG